MCVGNLRSEPPPPPKQLLFNHEICVGFVVLIASYMKTIPFWDMKPCRLKLSEMCQIVLSPSSSSFIGRFHPFIRHEGPYGEQSYSSTLILTSALEGGEGSASRRGRISPPRKTRYPLYRRVGGPQGRSGQVRKTSPPPGFDPRTFQPVGSRYTD
jgi:hypothetical protein